MNGFSQALEGQPPANDAQQAPPDMSQGTPATPEQQRAYNLFVAEGMTLLWSEQFMAKAVQMLKSHPNETEAMASLGSSIALRVAEAARKAGDPLPPEVLLHGGWELIHEVAEFAKAVGVQGIEPDEIETAFYIAADMVKQGLAKAGQFDDQAASQTLEEVRGAYGEEAFENVSRRMSQSQQKTAERLMAAAGGQQQ